MRLDLDAYLQRIDWTGDRAASAENLQRLAAAHASAIPFENLSPLTGEGVRLDLESLEAKLVRGGRGGYCFEQNLLFAEALGALGFEVDFLGARILWNREPGSAAPKTHMLLLVKMGAEAWIADVGFGGLTLTGALRLRHAEPQPTAHETFRLWQVGTEWRMEALAAGEWKPLYLFDTRPQLRSDFEIWNYYLSTHPASHFTTGLIAARPAQGRRFTLLNRRLVTHVTGGESTSRTLSSPDEIVATLGEVFGIRCAKIEALRARLQELPI